jgi:hypothetical protein
MTACAEPLTVYHFSGELRKPTVKIAARDTWSACAHYARKMGLASGQIVRPRSEAPFEPSVHKTVEIVETDEDALLEYPPDAFEEKYKGRRTKYGDADPDFYPLLNLFGRGSIHPEWVIDRKTGKVRIAGEFESFPKYFLDLTEKPSVDEVYKAGGRFNPDGGLDDMARILTDEFPWLQLEDSDGLRAQLLDEIDCYEREHR